MKKILSILMLLVAIVTGAKADEVTLYSYDDGTETHEEAMTIVGDNVAKGYTSQKYNKNATTPTGTITFPNSIIANQEIANAIKLEIDGGFKTGDKISIVAYYNNSKEKKANLDLYYDASTKIAGLTNDDIINARNVEGTPEAIDYTLEDDYDVLYIGRRVESDATRVNILKIYVTRTESSDPSLSVAPTTANAFTYVAGNGPSAAQKFTVTLKNSENKVSATLSGSNYEMSKTGEADSYTSEAFTDLANGSEVYVRLKAGLAKGTDYDGTLTFANADVEDNVVINLSGSVTGQTYTVTYELNGGSGDAPTQDPVEAGTQITLPAAASKDFYTFAGWLCDANNVVYDAEALYPMTAANTKFTAQWTGPSYSSTLDFAANSAAAPDIATFLASGNMISDVTGAWEALTAGKEGYGGFKVKKNNASLKFLAQAGKHVTITLGTVASNVTLKKNGNTAGTISGGTDYTGNTKMSIVAFDAGEEDVLVELVTSSNSTVTLIKIAIEDDLASTPVTVGATGFATIGLPYATTLPEGVTAYAVSETSATAVTVSEAIAAGTTIPANKGFIIVANQGDYTFNQFANNTWQGDVANKLEATGSSVLNATAEGDFYYFAIIDYTNKKVGFKKCAANASLAANKAYLPGTGLSSNSLVINFDDPTAVEAVQDVQEFKSSKVQKVIKNGQLFIGNYTVAGARVK